MLARTCTTLKEQQQSGQIVTLSAAVRHIKQKAGAAGHPSATHVAKLTPT